MARWQPSPFLTLSAGLHAAAGVGLLVDPAGWPVAVGALLANHAALTTAGRIIYTPKQHIDARSVSGYFDSVDNFCDVSAASSSLNRQMAISGCKIDG